MGNSTTLEKIADTVFAGNSILIFFVTMVFALLAGKLLATTLRLASRGVSKRADAATDLDVVNRLRRIETWLILSIAAVRVVSIIVGLYFWWIIVHPTQKPTALVGASALLAVVLSGVFGPLLRDFALGSGMMAEHWFGVGDLITVEPHKLQGVVERITLRATRIRGLNGETIWVNNQNIWSVSIAKKGVWPMAIELFVSDLKRAQELVERTNILLPTGPALVATRLVITSVDARSDTVWHVTAIGETAPGREWLLEKTAIDLLKKLDEQSDNSVLLTDPVARYADNDTERQFARAVRNAKKTRRQPRRRVSPKVTADTKK